MAAVCDNVTAEASRQREQQRPQQPEGEQPSRPRSPTNDEFSKQEYWDRRYAAEPEDADYDWFKRYAELRLHLRRAAQLAGVAPDEARVLMLGCGNSTLSADMAEDGFAHIVNVDYSSVVIERMRKRYPGQTWLSLDVRELAERADELGGAGSFDLALDKGTLDALMAERGGSVWDPSEEVRRSVKAEVDGVLHLLKPTGVFWYMTWNQPHFRAPYLRRPGWRLDAETFVAATTDAQADEGGGSHTGGAGGGGDGGVFPYYIFTMRRERDDT